jgi:Zn-dependent protease
MNETVRLGRVMGVPVGLNWSLVAIVGLFAFGLSENLFPADAPGYDHRSYIVAGAVSAVALLVGVLLHELGHAIAARHSGLEVEGITLSWMGGVTRIAGDSPTPGRELIVAGIGPLVSLVLGVALFGVREIALEAGSGGLFVAALRWLAVINIVLAAFNLIPAAPLDGGRVLHAFIWGVTRNRWKASQAASRAGLGLAVVVFALGLYQLAERTGRADRIDGFFVVVLAWWLFGAARDEERQAAVHHVLGGVRVHEVMRPVQAAPGWLSTAELISRYVKHRDPTSVWLLERWGGGYSGIVSSEALQALPPPVDAVRPEDIAIPVAAAGASAPDEEILDALERTGGRQILLVVEADRTVGAVLPADIEALVRSRRRPTITPPLPAGVR